jgi:hypothetical protein
MAHPEAAEFVDLFDVLRGINATVTSPFDHPTGAAVGVIDVRPIGLDVVD